MVILVEISLKTSHLAASVTFCILCGILWTVVAKLRQCAESKQRADAVAAAYSWGHNISQKPLEVAFCQNGCIFSYFSVNDLILGLG